MAEYRVGHVGCLRQLGTKSHKSTSSGRYGEHSRQLGTQRATSGARRCRLVKWQRFVKMSGHVLGKYCTYRGPAASSTGFEFVSVHSASIPYARDEHVLQFRMPVHPATDGEELGIFLTCFTLHASSCRKMRRSPHLEAPTLKDSGVSVSAHDHAGLC